jgi:hypothetical protein
MTPAVIEAVRKELTAAFPILGGFSEEECEAIARAAIVAWIEGLPEAAVLGGGHGRTMGRTPMTPAVIEAVRDKCFCLCRDRNCRECERAAAILATHALAAWVDGLTDQQVREIQWFRNDEPYCARPATPAEFRAALKRAAGEGEG